ncbi:hypothetical protein Y032_0029g1944 [Ancylostoma ceylanicum]|uniref:Uncharacterized protein n=1 Tax=Ancylostoma ceylanicum TaxID=53326 RepID=A0A016URQ7_9BILA|nr:hypothetical protein Y032_0029g1944 [Ancylostoma ceylanicum]
MVLTSTAGKSLADTGRLLTIAVSFTGAPSKPMNDDLPAEKQESLSRPRRAFNGPTRQLTPVRRGCAIDSQRIELRSSHPQYRPRQNRHP